MKKIVSLVLAVVMFAALLIPAMSVNAATAYTYYVSETGSDTEGDGTEAKPFKNIDAAMDKAIAVKYAEGDTVKFVIVGAVDASKYGSTNIQWLAVPSNATSTSTMSEAMFLAVRDEAGAIQFNEDKSPKMIPLTIEGKDASSKLVFTANADGARRRYWCNEVTLKNITCTFNYIPYASGETTLALADLAYHQYLTATVAPVTYDNVKFDTSNGEKWRLSAEAFGGVPKTKMVTLKPQGEILCKNAVILKNGDYTKLEVIGALYHYSDSLSTNEIQATSLTPSLYIGAGAKVQDVYGLSCNPSKGAYPVVNVVVEDGGEVLGTLYGTNSGTEDKAIERKTNLNILVKSGAKVNAIKVVGDFVTMQNNVTVTVEAGATCGTITEKGVSSTVAEGFTITVDKKTATTPETPAPNPTPSAPATADASEIVLFSFIALASLAGVVVLKKVTFAR